MRVRRLGEERGAISAEYVAIVVLVAAVVAALVSAAMPQRVGDAAGQATDCLFRGETCDLSASDEGSAEPGGTGGDDGATVGRGGGPTDASAPASYLGPAARHEADVDRQIQGEAVRLRDLADRDLADVAAWDELQALTASITDPTTSAEQRDADLERYEEVLAQVEAAPDGSLLAELRRHRAPAPRPVPQR